jgi:FkbM family methyltransferase
MALLGKRIRRAVLAHRGWRYRRRVDPDEIRWMRSVLREGDVAVDVGAHKGGYTYWMRRAVGAGGAVFAFEPQPALSAYLRACVADFGWRNVAVMDCALSSEPGERTLLIPGADAPLGATSPGASLVGASLPPGSRGYAVPCNTLDRVLRVEAPGVRVRLIKCDVEGHELDVLLGADETIRHDRPLLLFECEARHDPSRPVDAVFDHLGALGYRGFFFLDGDQVPVERLDPAIHQVAGRRPYVNNFVFVPEAP